MNFIFKKDSFFDCSAYYYSIIITKKYRGYFYKSFFSANQQKTTIVHGEKCPFRLDSFIEPCENCLLHLIQKQRILGIFKFLEERSLRHLLDNGNFTRWEHYQKNGLSTVCMETLRKIFISSMPSHVVLLNFQPFIVLLKHQIPPNQLPNSILKLNSPFN